MTTRLLFVCLGNICRSPTAEAVARRLIAERGLTQEIDVESAALGPWHVGNPADARAAAAGARRGTPLTGTARQVTTADFDRFDLVIGLDTAIVDELRRIAPRGTQHKVRPLTEEGVPDPYYGDDQEFDIAFDLIEKACVQLLDDLRQA